MADEYVSTFNAVLNAVKLRIRCSDLADIGIENIIVRKVKRKRERFEFENQSLPAIIVSPFTTETIPLGGGTNIRDDISYPVRVSMIDKQRQDATDGEPAQARTGCVDQKYEFDDRLRWREQIRKRFIRQRLPPITSIYTCEVEPLQIIDAAEFEARNIWVSELLLRFISREPRGVT